MLNKNILLFHLIRVLTPEELSELTTTSKGRSLISLTKILIDDIDAATKAESAKVLPFRRKEALPSGETKTSGGKLPVIIECGSKCKTVLDDHIKRVAILNKDYSKNCPIVQETSNFIISEKDRFKSNYVKSKSAEILSLYKKNASVDIEREKACNEDLSKSSNLGVLINKKQA